MLLLLSARRTLELCIFIDLNPPVSMDRHIFVFFSKSCIAYRKGEPNAGLGARGEGGVVRLSVDELVEPELQLPLSTVIRPLCCRDIRFLFC
jgi:hypothetical protein